MQVRAGQHRILHHSFVSALLNDLFGIQSRSGCACAGPFALQLLGIRPEMAARFEAALLDKQVIGHAPAAQ